VLQEDLKDLVVNIENDILETINRDPEEEKRRSLYISPLKPELKVIETNLSIEDVASALKQILGMTDLIGVADLGKASIRNNKGYTRLPFHDNEFMIEWGKFFLEDRRICRIQNEIYQVIVPKNSSNVALYFGGWNQSNLTPKEISEFLSSIPNFPYIVGVVCPRNEKSGRFNPFFCFVTINSEHVERVLKLKIKSGNRTLIINVARDRKPFTSED